jgi:pimeloyl-ACP methyl ester carboxylesterase
MQIRSERIGPVPQLAVDLCGSGTPLVFLHGLGGNRNNWRRQLERFGRDRLAVAFDFRGYGDSDDPPGTLVFGHFADDLERVLAACGGGPADIVGLSMGGLVAQLLLARRPECVRSLALIACRPGDAPVAPGKQGRAFLAERLSPIREGGAEALATSLAPKLLGRDVPAAAHDEILASLKALRPNNYLATLAARLTLAPFLDLSAVRVPVLVMAGTEDRVASLAQMEALAAALPDSRLVVLEGAGHLLNIEQPAQFDAALAEFLDEISTPRARYARTRTRGEHA